MKKKKIYIAPEAELLLLIPHEDLAAKEFRFGDTFAGNWFSGLNTMGSAFGIINGGAGLDESFWEEDGFVIKK